MTDAYWSSYGEFQRAEDNLRGRSPESDYGVHWRGDQDDAPRYGAPFRVSYIQTTGEIYALNLRSDEVIVLGVVPADSAEIGEIYYRTVDEILRGWEEEFGRPLEWIRDRLRAAGY